MIVLGMAMIVTKCGPRVVLPCLTVVFLICLETVLLCTESTCSKSFYVHWNTTNSIFRIDNTDHIIDVNKGNVQFEYDQVNIICPVYVPGTYDDEPEKYIIYNVSKEEYETCRITNPNPRIIAICDKPYKLMYFTITFRPFTPQPGGLEFLPGNDYYFISTSSKDDLHRRVGGRCSTHNMKIVFKVCCAPERTNSSNSNDNILLTSNMTRNPSYYNTATVSSMSSINWPIRTGMGPATVRTSVTQQSLPHNIYLGTTSRTLSDQSPSTRKTIKKTDDHDKNENEVMKTEDLVYNNCTRLQYSQLLVLLLLFLLFVSYARWR